MDKAMINKTQQDFILDYLIAGNTLTGMEALNRFHVWRLASRISDIKKEGHDIRSETIRLPNGKHVSKYWIQTKVEDKGQLAFNLIGG